MDLFNESMGDTGDTQLNMGENWDTLLNHIVTRKLQKQKLIRMIFILSFDIVSSRYSALRSSELKLYSSNIVRNFWL